MVMMMMITMMRMVVMTTTINDDDDVYHGEDDDDIDAYTTPGPACVASARVLMLSFCGVCVRFLLADPNCHGPRDERPGRRPATGQAPAPQLQHPQLRVPAADQAAQERYGMPLKLAV